VWGDVSEKKRSLRKRKRKNTKNTIYRRKYGAGKNIRAGRTRENKWRNGSAIQITGKGP